MNYLYILLDLLAIFINEQNESFLTHLAEPFVEIKFRIDFILSQGDEKFSQISQFKLLYLWIFMQIKIMPARIGVSA